MRSLDFGFYGEGSRDYGFLVPIIERTLNELLPNSDIQSIKLDWLVESGAQKIVRIAEKTQGYMLVIVHLDADHSDTSRALHDRFQPDYAEILKQSEKYNVNIVPLIPVRTTEAWMLVDFEAFCRVVPTELTASDLGFPETPKQAEAIANPKLIFEQAINKVSRNRRKPKNVPLAKVYLLLAEEIDLNKLKEVPAYQEFEERLKEMLRDLHYID